MGLGSVHRLCVVGSLGEKRLRSHRLLKVGGVWRGGGGKPILPGPKGSTGQGHRVWAPLGALLLSHYMITDNAVLGSASGLKSQAPTLSCLVPRAARMT